MEILSALGVGKVNLEESKIYHVAFQGVGSTPRVLPYTNQQG